MDGWMDGGREGGIYYSSSSVTLRHLHFVLGRAYINLNLIINHAFSACSLLIPSQLSEASHFRSVIDIVLVSTSIALYMR